MMQWVTFSSDPDVQE
jgi:hypothetical protein